MSKDRLLITGSSGFIGRYVIKNPKLSCFEVLAPSRKELDLMNHKNVKEYIEKNKPIYLMHLAWITAPGIYKTSLENIMWVNASRNLFREFTKKYGIKTIGIGTGLEYDQSFGYFMEGITPMNPNTLYGTCKLHTNTILKDSLKFYSWARIFNVYGLGEPKSKLITSTINSISNNKPVHINNPDSVIDFIYVKDVADILVNLLYKTHREEINLSSGIPITIREVVDYIERSLNKENLVSYQNSKSTMYVGNNSKLCRMGMEPEFTLRLGIEDMMRQMGVK